MATNEEMVLKLMQNVSDELEGLSAKISELEQAKEKNEEFLDRQKKLLAENINATSEAFTAVLEKNPPIVNQTRNSKYVLFGKDTPLLSKLLLFVIAFCLICIPIFKYVPSYLNEKSELKEERDNYKLFYDYVFFNAFENRKTTHNEILQTLNEIKAGDSTYTNYVERLKNQYKTHLKKENLKAELQKLEE